EKALDIYKHLSQSDQAALSVGALYNLGNLHLREALKDGAAEAHRYLPLIELAKQRYREALRRRPDSWDARYNLEAALLLAPEADDPAFEEDEPSDQEDRVISTLPGGRIALPCARACGCAQPSIPRQALCCSPCCSSPPLCSCRPRTSRETHTNI